VRLFVAIDLEGVTGVVAEQDTARSGPAAEMARRHMRADLDAVLAGCLAAGAREIVVCDAHDDGRNLDPAGLPGSVVLNSGPAAPHSMLQGIGPGFEGALFVGYHARAGTAAAVLEHTWNYKVFSACFGDVEVGEFGMGALVAGHYGVPAIYLSGDDKAALEAEALVPGIVTTVVKRGITRLAAERAGKPTLSQLVDGPTALAFGYGDILAVARAFSEYAPTAPPAGGGGRGRQKAIPTYTLTSGKSVRDEIIQDFKGKR